MNDSNLLKLVFFHDQRMEELSSSKAVSNQTELDPLALFTQPDPTYSRLLFMGTELADKRFGLNCLEHNHELVAIFNRLYSPLMASKSSDTMSLGDWIENAPVNAFIIVQSNERAKKSEEELTNKVLENGGLFSEATEHNNRGWDYEISSDQIHTILMQGYQVLIKIPTANGYDLEIYSRSNPYISFFYPIQSMLPDAFRFFSINGKRVHTREALYFEFSRLHNPPHGYEEVYPESVL
jgi:hypothetical protein